VVRKLERNLMLVACSSSPSRCVSWQRGIESELLDEEAFVGFQHVDWHPAGELAGPYEVA